MIKTNPAHAVRGPNYVVNKGKTPVLNVGEARLSRINAVLQMKVADYFVQERRAWVRLHEKRDDEALRPALRA